MKPDALCELGRGELVDEADVNDSAVPRQVDQGVVTNHGTSARQAVSPTDPLFAFGPRRAQAGHTILRRDSANTASAIYFPRGRDRLACALPRGRSGRGDDPRGDAAPRAPGGAR